MSVCPSISRFFVGFSVTLTLIHFCIIWVSVCLAVMSVCPSISRFFVGFTVTLTLIHFCIIWVSVCLVNFRVSVCLTVMSVRLGILVFFSMQSIPLRIFQLFVLFFGISFSWFSRLFHFFFLFGFSFAFAFPFIWVRRVSVLVMFRLTVLTVLFLAVRWIVPLSFLLLVFFGTTLRVDFFAFKFVEFSAGKKKNRSE